MGVEPRNHSLGYVYWMLLVNAILIPVADVMLASSLWLRVSSESAATVSRLFVRLTELSRGCEGYKIFIIL